MKHVSVKQPFKHRGFTLVELIVVITALGILTTISIVGINAVIKSSKESEVKTALTNARQKIDDYKKKEGSYPQQNQLPAGTVPASYEENFYYVSSYSWCGTGQCFCMELENLVGVPGFQTPINYHISSINSDPLPGSCSGFQQEALGNGQGGQTVTATSNYGDLEVEGKTPLKGKFKLNTNRPPGYVSTALVRAAVYLNGTFHSAFTTTQYGNYNGTGTAGWYLGSVNYGSSTAVVKVEWQDPANGWSELIAVTLP